MTTSWLKKLLLEPSPLTRPAVRLMAKPGPMALVMVVRDEADIVAQNIEFHLSLGVRQFIVTDNGSADGTRDILAGFERRLGPAMVVLEDPREGHRQAERVTRMIELAKRRFRPRWILPADADEFWYPASGAYDTDFNGRQNILDCPWHNFLPRAGTPWQDFSDIGEMPGYNGRTSKALCLARGLRGMYLGNHEARCIPHVRRTSDNIRVYHYPIRSYAQFERKVVQGHLAALKASGGADGSWHWREYYEAWQAGRLPEVFQGLAERNRLAQDGTMAAWFRAHAGDTAPPVTASVQNEMTPQEFSRR